MGLVRLALVTTATVLFVSSAAAQSPTVLAATEPAHPAADASVPAKPDAPTTDVAVSVPPASGMYELRGHQASDAALPAAVSVKLPEEVVEAKPLQRPKPTLFADIDLTNQRMTVSDENGVIDSWKVSTARGGYKTPTGTYTANWTSRMHYSKQYHNSPMPYSVFFNRGVAVHGTNAVSRLGRPASHGCVRSHTRDAKKFYNLVHKHGLKLTKITVHGTPPYTPVVQERRRRRYREPTFAPFGFFAAQPPSYQPKKRRYRKRYGSSW
jgi:lipoprotein-anchoring transpeptidase ErfK/SrfK